MGGRRSKAFDDSGAFGFLTASEQRLLDGAAYKTLAELAKSERSLLDWNLSFLLAIHRDLFSAVFPSLAGIYRTKEVTFRDHDVPGFEQMRVRLYAAVEIARSIIVDAKDPALRDADRIDLIIPRVAHFHAECVVIQPFIDGNKRWARQVMNALLTDTGFYPGSEISDSQRVEYLDGIDKALLGYTDQLGDLILGGWLRLKDLYLKGHF